MATSGTYTFSLDFDRVIQNALAMVGGEPSSAEEQRRAIEAINLVLIGWQNRGLNLWQVAQSTVSPLVLADGDYTLPASLVDVLEMAYRDGSSSPTTDTILTRITRSEYAALPNKLHSGRPTQFCVLREYAAPRVLIWPVPDATAVDSGSLYYWCVRRNEDATGHIEDPAIPQRFLPALVSGLAHRLSFTRSLSPDPNMDMARRQALHQLAETDLVAAMKDDREKVAIRIAPDLSAYTRI